MKETKKRGWVKNAAIIFLAVMLALTFFSNTIMNWSLPEVSGQYSTYNSISTAIRGSGTVKANMGYSVQIGETRKIKAVYVRNGDRVEAGQTLFELDAAESEELQTELDKLEDLEYAYNVKLLNLTSPDYDESNENISELKSQISELTAELSDVKAQTRDYADACYLRDKLKAEVEKLGDELEEINDSIASVAEDASSESTLVASRLKTLNAAKKTLESAKAVLEAATKAREDFASGMEMSLSQATENYEALKRTYDAMKKSYDDAAEDYAALLAAKQKYDAALTDYYKAESDLAAAKSACDSAYAAYTAKLDAYNELIDSESASETEIADAKAEAERKAVEAETLRVVYERYKDAGDPAAESAKKEYDRASAEAQVLMKKYQGLVEKRANSISAHQTELEGVKSAETAYKNAEKTLETKQKAVDEKQTAINGLEKVTDSELKARKRELDASKVELDYKKAELDKALEAVNTAKTNEEKLTSLKKAEETAEADVAKYQKACDAAQSAVDSAVSSLTKTLQSQKKTLETKLKDKNKQLAAAEKNVAELTPERTASDIEAELKTLNKSLQKAVSDLAKQQEADNKTSQLNEMELSRDREAIEAQKKVVSELQGKGEGSAVTARYAGVVSSVNCVAGDRAENGMTLATIDVEGKGYTLTLTVSNQQAQQLKVGDTAKAVDYWWGNVNIVLQAIKTDPSSSGKSKLLEFSVEGDVSDGQNLTISVGEKQEYYNCVVPNSALREDKDGKFVLTTYSKSTPLGNRYYAKRVNVKVIASDTVNSAIDTDQDYFYDFVIISSTAPVEAGDQVRMAAEK